MNYDPSFYPDTKPYRTGFLPVSDGHRLWYACFGNPKGVPILLVHGGPGAGTSDTAHRYFDPKRCHILAIDQRGAGRSRPFAGLQGNTTDHLVQDLHDFLRFLGVDRAFLSGGSWGSCLGLVFALRHPDMVLGLLLRGIYLGSGFRDDFMFTGRSASHFPEAWERFLSHVPPAQRKNPCDYYWKRMGSKDPAVARLYCREWALYESSMLSLEVDFPAAARKARGRWVVPIARLEAHYISRNCFLTKDHILRHVCRIQHLPVSIVHGRYDFICPPENAVALHRALPKSRLHLVTAGHSSKDPAIVKTLRDEMARMIREVAPRGRVR
jgi:proline iminopeptidase